MKKIKGIFENAEELRGKEYVKRLNAILREFTYDFFENRNLNIDDSGLCFVSFYTGYSVPKTRHPETFIALIAENCEVKNINKIMDLLPLNEMYNPYQITRIINEILKFAKYPDNVLTVIIHFTFQGLVSSIAVNYYRASSNFNPILFDLYVEIFKNKCKIRKTFLSEYKKIRRIIRKKRK